MVSGDARWAPSGGGVRAVSFLASLIRRVLPQAKQPAANVFTPTGADQPSTSPAFGGAAFSGLMDALNAAKGVGNVVNDISTTAGDYKENAKPLFQNWHKYASLPVDQRLSALRSDIVDAKAKREEAEAMQRDQDFIAEQMKSIQADQDRAEMLHQKLYDEAAATPAPPTPSMPRANLGEVIASMVTGAATGGQFAQANNYAMDQATRRTDLDHKILEAAYEHDLAVHSAQFGLDKSALDRLMTLTGQKQNYLQQFQQNLHMKREQNAMAQANRDVMAGDKMMLERAQHADKMSQLTEKANADRNALKAMGYSDDEVRNLLTAKYQKDLSAVGVNTARENMINVRTQILPTQVQQAADRLKLQWAEHMRKVDWNKFRKEFDVKKFNSDSTYRDEALRLRRTEIQERARLLGVELDAKHEDMLVKSAIEAASGAKEDLDDIKSNINISTGELNMINGQLETLYKKYGDDEDGLKADPNYAGLVTEKLRREITISGLNQDLATATGRVTNTQNEADEKLGKNGKGPLLPGVKADDPHHTMNPLSGPIGPSVELTPEQAKRLEKAKPKRRISKPK